MARSYPGGFARAFVVLNFGNEKKGLVVELTQMEMTRDPIYDGEVNGYETYRPSPKMNIELRGIVISIHSPDERPDLTPPQQITEGTRQIPEKT